MFKEDELAQARAVSVLKIAEDHGAKLKSSGRERVGPCPVCGGVNRFSVLPPKNIWNCRGCSKGGDAIALEMHLSGGSFADAMRALIGKDAGTPTRRQPTPEEDCGARCGARSRAASGVEAEEQRRNASSAARIVACLQPVSGTPGEDYLRNVRCIDVSHWTIRRVLEGVETLGWSERTFFRQEDPSKPGHELNGHRGSKAIVAILTDPVTAARRPAALRGPIIHKEGRKLGRARRCR